MGKIKNKYEQELHLVFCEILYHYDAMVTPAHKTQPVKAM